MQKKTLLIALLILIVTGGIAVTGPYIGKKLAQPQEEPFGFPSTEPEEIASGITPTEPRGINISNWKTYRDSEYGIEIRYPNNWYQLDEKKDGKFFVRFSANRSGRGPIDEFGNLLQDLASVKCWRSNFRK